MVEKENQRIGAIPRERNCLKENTPSCLKNQEILCETFVTRSKGFKF